MYMYMYVPFRVGRPAGDWFKETDLSEAAVQEIEQSNAEWCEHVKYFAHKMASCKWEIIVHVEFT